VNNTSILSSTFLLTLLLMVGLFFFIRASVKERTEQIELIAEESEESLLERLQAYFSQRAYQVSAVDAQKSQIVFQGIVRPSWFLAIFLSVLAALGLLCLALVFSFLYPSGTIFFLALTLFAPAAGVFYWRGAKRLEKVFLKVESLSNAAGEPKTLAIVTAHRDELTQLQQALPWKLASTITYH
jgi:Flp pilus assembly protein TadB